MRPILWLPLAILHLATATGASAQARRTYVLTKASRPLATEIAVQRADTSFAESSLEGQPYLVSGRVVRRAGTVSSFDGRVEAPSGTQTVHIDIAGNLATATAIRNGETREGSVAIDSTKPLLVFENLLFSLLGAQVARLAETSRLAEDSSMTVQVLLPDAMLMQPWRLQRLAGSVFVLTTLDGLEMRLTLAGGRLEEFRVPGQDVLVRVAPREGGSPGSGSGPSK